MALDVFFKNPRLEFLWCDDDPHIVLVLRQKLEPSALCRGVKPRVICRPPVFTLDSS